MKKVTRIFGPPGTGKTTRLLEIVEKALSNDVAPERIAYLSFSTKAAQEAIDRACNKFNIEASRFKYFRTIHSLGFMSQALGRDEGMDYDDYKSIADELSLEISKVNNSDDSENSYGNLDGDNCMSIHNLARNKLISLHEQWQAAEMQVSIPFAVVEQWAETVKAYKEKYGKHDFSDMLENFKGSLNVDVLIVDEAQDLSKLQWQVIREASANVPEVYIAGDDDQCIFSWSGADVEEFLNFPVDEEIVLPKSWRVPSNILKVADEISSRLKVRKEKSWLPVGEGGNIFQDEDLYELPIESGEWMILVRNAKFSDFAKRMLEQKGFLYNDNRFKNNKRSIKIEEAQAITNWEKLRKGEAISMGAANELIKRINPKVTMASSAEVFMKDMPFVESFKKQPWYDVFNKSMHPRHVEYIRSCLRNGQKLTDKPRITVSTIHRVKGGEAENVAIIPDYSYLSAQFLDSDDEHRVQYVAVTRAKNNLYIIRPETEYFYEY